MSEPNSKFATNLKKLVRKRASYKAKITSALGKVTGLDANSRNDCVKLIDTSLLNVQEVDNTINELYESEGEVSALMMPSELDQK